MSIRTRIILAALAVVAAVTTASVAYTVDHERRAAVARLHNTVREDDRLLQVVTSGPLYDGNVAQLNAILDSIFANHDVLEVELAETRGDIRLARKRDGAPQRGERIERRVRVLRGPDELGTIRVAYTTANIEQRLAESRNTVILFSLLLMGALSILIYVLAARLTRPIERLTRAAREIAGGDLERDIDTRGAQELQILGQSFIQMRDAVRDKIADLAEKNRQLLAQIDERVRTENALRASEERFAKMFREAPELMTLVRAADGRFLDVNDEFERQTGYARAEAIGRTSLEIGLWRSPEQREEMLRTLRKNGRVEEWEFQFWRRDGTYRFTLIDAVAVDLAGEPCWLFIIRDITERRQAEQALRESEAKISEAHATLDDAIESAPAAIAVYDATDRLIAFNSRFTAFFAFDPGIVAPGVRFETLVRRFTESGQVARPTRTGEGWLEVRTRTHRDPSSPIEMELTDGRWLQITETRTRSGGIVTVYSDITELKERESELRRLNEELERKVAERTADLAAANKELEAFVYSVSHDLRAPLRGIDGFSHLLVAKYGESLDGEARELLERVRAAAQRMGRLIADLLELSRLARSAVRRTDVDLSELARGVVDELGGEAAGRAVEWHVEPGMRVRADPALLRIALMNLLGNALKYTRDASTARIELGTTRRQGGFAEFFVRDNGAGFDMNYAARLFQPFQRLHAQHEFEGTGIGLAIVQRVIAKHGGEIRGDGRPGAGATFYFTLPV